MNELPFDHGYRYKAIFNPKRLDNLRAELKPAIGKELILRYAWTADEDESYAGQPVFTEDIYDQIAIQRKDLDETLTKGYWIPLEDLDDIKIYE